LGTVLESDPGIATTRGVPARPPWSAGIDSGCPTMRW
jgi:hypothetical protein